MKKILCSLLAMLMLLAQAGAQESLMTREAFLNIWEDSCRRMNITFEAEITALPAEGDMPYQDALAWAKYWLNHRFGVTEETLDAMGVYPRFLEGVSEEQGVWEFLFSPLRDGDVLAKHAADELGEFYVHFGARTGETYAVEWVSTRLADDVLIPLAEAAALEASQMDAQAFADHYSPGFVHRFEQPEGTCVIFIYARTVDQPGGDSHVYQVILDYMTGEVVNLYYTDGVG